MTKKELLIKALDEDTLHNNIDGSYSYYHYTQIVVNGIKGGKIQRVNFTEEEVKEVLNADRKN